MSVPRCLVLVIFLFATCGLCAGAQTDTASTAKESAPNGAIDPELALIKDHLFNNKDSSTRISAASVLLFKEDPAARALVLEALKQSENPAARAAVCKALDRSRTDARQLRNKEDFLPPLVAILSTGEDGGIAALAAEATLMFSYDQVQSDLEKIADDSQLSTKIRSNAVYALQLYPDKRAALKLINLLDSPDSELGAAAKNALTLLGISVGEDAEMRRQAVSELQQLGPEAYLRKRLVRSEADIRDLRGEMASWQRHYFSALGEWYGTIGDEAARSGFLAERLKAAEPAIKLWALDRLEELKKGTSKPKLSEELEKTLLGLVSNRNRQVRLKTARLLALMWELNSSERLLQQLEVEEDPEVKHGLFVALGGACYYASLPTSDVKVSEDVRRKTLEWAVTFVDEQSAGRVRSGADVIRKLLEQDGLKPEEVDKYLNALARRYGQAGTGGDHGLRGELLNAMAGLCAERSVCRSQAIKLYGPLFEQALGDAADAVRQAAVDGFVSIDKAAALRRLKKGLIDDPSPSIQARLINLAGEVGVPEDLDWLWKKIDTPAESEPAWLAMLKIFRRSGTESMAKWMGEFEAPATQNRLSVERKISFLTLVEQKALGENKPALLKEVRKKLAESYVAANNTQQTIEYLTLVVGAAGDDGEKEGVWSELLGRCLERSNFELAGEIVANYLLNKDLSHESAVAQSIEGYLKEPPSGADPNALLDRLSKVEVKDVEGRPGWSELRKKWSALFAKATKAEEVDKTAH